MRRLLFRSFFQGLIPAIAALSLGCNEGYQVPSASSSTTQAQVKGKVTLNGNPVAKADVTFNPANVNRRTAPSATVKTNDNGTYELTTLVGENTVTLGGGRSVAKKQQLQYFSKTFDVQPGDNSFDIDVR